MLKTKIKYYLVVLTICFCQLTLFAQNKNIEYLLDLLTKDKPDISKAIHLNKLGWEYYKTGNYDTALSYSNSSMQLSLKLNYTEGIVEAYCLMGSISNDYKGDFPRALDFYLKALKLEEELKDKNGLAGILGNIGNVYVEQGNYHFALNYYLKALKLSEELGNKNAIERHLGNMGIVYSEEKDNLKALDCFFKALKMAEELEDKNGIAAILTNIGIIYCTQGNYPKALEYYFKALKIAEELGNKIAIANSLSNIGSLYTKTGKFKESEQYHKRAITIVDSIGALDYLRQFEESLSHLYDTTGQHKLALIYYKKATALKDTLFSQENKKELVRKEMNYEFDKRETAAKAQQDKKDAVTASEKQRQKVIIYSISIGLFLVLLLAFFIFRGYRLKQKANIIITQQKAEVEKQKELVEVKNKEITDSINYARRIQQAKLPKKEEIYSALPQSFILFKPKDIVSGDFYFFYKNEQTVFIASADCTGHGVPGAFMSMIGSEKLEDAVSQTTDTSEILKLLNKGIKTSLHQSEINESTRDGMDIALVSLKLKVESSESAENTSKLITHNFELKYAGANRPIWIIRKGQTEVEEIKATKKAIGGFTEDNQHFDTQEIKLQQGDTFYISTDGYADQFGGAEGKKLMTKRFKEILLDIQNKPMQEQEKYLETFIDNWRGKREQIDDILVIGVRL